MRHILSLIVAALFMTVLAAPAQAAPVLPGATLLQQPDGTVIEAVPYGDEWENGYETRSGYTLVRDEASGVWSYAIRTEDGRLAPSGVLPPAAPDGLPPHLRAGAQNPNRLSVSAMADAGLAGSSTQPVLVLLVAFSDRGPVGTSAADWATLFFSPTQSARHYYQEVSYNQFSLTPASESHGAANDGIIGWLTMSYRHPNTQGSTGIANKQITRDAIVAADPFVDFASYDANHDGTIAKNELHIVVIVAGYETSYGGSAGACSPSVWGHQSSLGFGVAAPSADGVTVGAWPKGGYAQFGEWHCMTRTPPGHMATMGIMVHELGHDINWPDLYDVDYSSYGVGEWSIMSSGSWLALPGEYDGSMPPHPDAFLKWYQGWLTPTQISGDQTGVLIERIETSQSAIQLRNNANGVDWLFNTRSGVGEYFLLENRQAVGYDAALPGCGILIWHIDETRPSSNQANANDSRRLVDLEEADGRNDLDRKANQGDAGDPYPGSTGNVIFDLASTPNSKLYSGAASGVRVTNISGCAGSMTADISTAASGASPTPTATRTRTPSCTPTLKPTRTPGGPWWSLAFPVVLLNNPPAPPTATPTRTPTVTQTPVPSGWVTIMEEAFEGSFPGVWQVFDMIPNNGEHYWGKRDCRAYQGQFSGWAVGGGGLGEALSCGSLYPNAATSIMRYGPFSLVGASAAEVSLKAWVNMENWFDTLCIYASQNGQDFFGQCIGGHPAAWADWGLDLSNVGTLGNLAGQPQAWIAIEFVADEDTNLAEGAYVDNIVLSKCVDAVCPASASYPGSRAAEMRLP